MVNSRTSRLDETFFALSDPTRRGILRRLAEGEAAVGELARPFDVSAPAISKHLRVLERAGLIEQRRCGRERRCHLAPAPLQEAADYMSELRHFWEAQLDSLARFLETPPPP